MSREPLLPGVGLGAPHHLAPVDRVVGMQPAVSLQVFFTSKRLVAVGALVHTLNLLAATVAVDLAVAVIFLTDNNRSKGEGGCLLSRTNFLFKQEFSSFVFYTNRS